MTCGYKVSEEDGTPNSWYWAIRVTSCTCTRSCRAWRARTSAAALLCMHTQVQPFYVLHARAHPTMPCFFFSYYVYCKCSLFPFTRSVTYCTELSSRAALRQLINFSCFCKVYSYRPWRDGTSQATNNPSRGVWEISLWHTMIDNTLGLCLCVRIIIANMPFTYFPIPLSLGWFNLCIYIFQHYNIRLIMHIPWILVYY